MTASRKLRKLKAYTTDRRMRLAKKPKKNVHPQELYVTIPDVGAINEYTIQTYNDKADAAHYTNRTGAPVGVYRLVRVVKMVRGEITEQAVKPQTKKS